MNKIIKSCVCIVLIISLLLGICVFASANGYDYGVAKLELVEGYDNINSTWGKSALGVVIGTLTGSYKFGVNDFKTNHNLINVSPKLRLRFGCYGFKGLNADFSRALSTQRQEIITKIGYFANDALFTYNRVLVSNDDTLKFQFSFTSNLPISEMRLQRYNFNTTSNAGGIYILQEGRDYTKSGELYNVNFEIRNSPVDFSGLFFEVDCMPYMYPGVSGTNWRDDYWNFNINSTLIPFWGKTSVIGTSNTANPSGNPTGNVPNIVYDYSDDLDGIYNLITILLDWQKLHLQSSMAIYEDLVECEKLLMYIDGMLQIIDTDLGIISADVSDLLASQYYAPGITWSERIYGMINSINTNVANFKSSMESYLSSISTDTHLIYMNSGVIIGKLNDIYNELNDIENRLDDIYDWLEDFDLDNDTNTKSVLMSVFEWIKTAFLTTLILFKSALGITVFSDIRNYNSNGSAIIYSS